MKDLQDQLNNIYSNYPKKAGKKNGFTRLTKILKKSPELYEDILAGAKLYKRYCEVTDRDKEYIKMFSTWVNGHCWEDEYDLPSTREEVDAELQALLSAN